MMRAILYILFTSLILLTGCSREEEQAPPAPATQERVRSDSWWESQLLAGREVYETACASCHDSGEGGAPMTGDRDAWSERSDLWTAVLAGHAKAGYLDMPEKGGHGELTDEDVSAAVEYMMLQTFPERPRD